MHGRAGAAVAVAVALVAAVVLCAAGPSLGRDRAAAAPAVLLKGTSAVAPATAVLLRGASAAAPATAVLLKGTSAAAPALAGSWRSRAAVEWEARRGQPIDPHPIWSFVMPPAAAPVPRTPEALGFLPSWNVGKTTFHLERLTTIAYFSVPVDADGTLGGAGYWGTPTLAPVLDAAHAAGVRVVLTVSCFDGATLGALLASPTARAKAVSGLVDAVTAAGGDGVNVDFEGLPSAAKADFVTFVGQLKAALDAALATSYVTVDTPAIDWSGTYDYDGLALAGDGLIVMGYDYYWSGGDPGPVAPLAAADATSRLSLTWTLDDYDTWGGIANRDRFVLALPLYGYDWPVAADVVPGASTGDASARTYAECGRRAAAAGGWRWDAVSATPWLGYLDGGSPRQLWCENLDSLTAKVALAAGRHLGGVAYWALGYEEDSDEPWVALDRSYPPPVEPVPDETTPDSAADVPADVPTDAPADAPVEAVGDIAGDTGWFDVAAGDDTAVPDVVEAAPDAPGEASGDVGLADEGTPVDVVPVDVVLVDVVPMKDVGDGAARADDGTASADPGADPVGRSGGGCAAMPRANRPIAGVLMLAALCCLVRSRRRAGPRGPACP